MDEYESEGGYEKRSMHRRFSSIIDLTTCPIVPVVRSMVVSTTVIMNLMSRGEFFNI